MIIGAQLFSVRDVCQSQKQIRDTFRKLREIGYTSVQISGFSYDAEATRAAADEFDLHIGLTHTPIEKILNETDEVIRCHKVLGADVVGIGSPASYVFEDRTVDTDRLIAAFGDPVKKIEDAGLRFAYHNHYMEFKDLGGYNTMDVLFERTNWLFTLDTGWADYAGADAVKAIEKYADRLKYAHLKDFTRPEDGSRSITFIGNGVTPIDAIAAALKKAGTQVAYVEQDNAPESGDSIGEMKKSYDSLKAKGWS